MKRVVLELLAAAILFGALRWPAGSQSDQAAATPVGQATQAAGALDSLVYRLTVLDVASGACRVTMELAGSVIPDFELAMNSFFGSERLVVTELRLAAGQGSVSRLPGAVSRFRVQPASGRQTLRLEYGISLRQRVDDKPKGWLSAEYLLSNASWVFLRPVGLEARQYGARFDLPIGWSAYVPWLERDGLFTETDGRRFFEATIAAGRFERREADIGGSLVSLVIDQRFDPAFRERAFSDCFAMFRFIKTLFQAGTPDRHFSVVARADGFAEWQWYNESCYAQGEAVRSLADIHFQFPHRVFHTYNGFYPNGLDLEPSWFMEGCDEYFSAMALAVLRGDAGQRLVQACQEYQAGRGRYDQALAGYLRFPDDWPRESFLNYQKGLLVALLLDRALRQASAGRVDLAALHAELYRQYSGYAGRITDRDILALAKRLTGADLSGFWSDYVYGVATIDVAGLLADPDDDDLPGGLESLLGTDSTKADSDGDGYRDNAEYRYGSDPLRAASTPASALLVDGHIDRPERQQATAVSLAPREGAWLTAGRLVPPPGGWRLYWRVRDGALYVGCELPTEAVAGHRYFLNVDLDGDGRAELQFAARRGQAGDMARFRPDWSSYGQQALSAVEGLRGAAVQAVEFSLPLELLQIQGEVVLWPGIYDPAAGQMLWLYDGVSIAW